MQRCVSTAGGGGPHRAGVPNRAPRRMAPDPTAAAVVLTLERIGPLCDQPLISDTGFRLFGGHTPRVAGAQLFAAMGIEINKIRLLARHSGDAISVAPQCFPPALPLVIIT